MIREVRREGEDAAHGECLVQLTESAGVVDVDDKFSWCCDFNRRVYKGDGSWPNSHAPRVPLYRGSSLNPNPA